ncbi:hypothetical protein EIN_044900 [Entamoeba invadens IP1]|uniref:Uncharacterized protein n=1 Tax=Entamoeba invadens IP1 TaxID=370355 RepID=L7FPT0_ENTIV|nr:hypothetical protein EIN_044900 [Entamoeba invadens IP1]ELP91964.1 hypothetical protein EIN_044900 [Entamoeba invadens IP1]|eukprot:XP_004258735.1 hypothetical protein EIN_044900 [Entamoeba invadens IP1]
MTEIRPLNGFELPVYYVSGHFYWYKLDDKWLIDNVDLYITKVPFEETKEIEAADYNLPQEGVPLFHVEYSENGATSRLKLYANHLLCDRRTIANLYQPFTTTNFLHLTIKIYKPSMKMFYTKIPFLGISHTFPLFLQ